MGASLIKNEIEWSF